MYLTKPQSVESFEKISSHVIISSSFCVRYRLLVVPSPSGSVRPIWLIKTQSCCVNASPYHAVHVITIPSLPPKKASCQDVQQLLPKMKRMRRTLTEIHRRRATDVSNNTSALTNTHESISIIPILFHLLSCKVRDNFDQED